MVEILGSAPSHTLLIGAPSQYQNNILNEIVVQHLGNGGAVALLADSLSQVNTAKSELVALAKERGVTERQLGRLFPIPDVPRLGVEKLSDTISAKAGRGANLLVVHDLSGHVAETKSDRVWFTTVKSILAFLRCNVLTAASYGAEPNRQSADYSAGIDWRTAGTAADRSPGQSAGAFAGGHSRYQLRRPDCRAQSSRGISVERVGRRRRLVGQQVRHGSA